MPTHSTDTLHNKKTDLSSQTYIKQLVLKRPRTHPTRPNKQAIQKILTLTPENLTPENLTPENLTPENLTIP